MNKIDCVMLAYSKTSNVKKMTQEAITTLHESTKDYQFNVYVIETATGDIQYKGATVIQPGIPFNYNVYMNIGIAKCTSEYVILANNDLYFHKGWFEEIVKAGADCASPWTDRYGPHEQLKGKIVPGFRTGIELCGWCLVLKKTALDKIGKFDEQFDFWYQDSDLGMQLIKNQLTHKLVGTSWVTHLYSQSHKLLTPEDLKAKTVDAVTKFKAKYNNSTLCLVMMVRDESKVICEALESIYKYINYYIIVDTGSVDNTKEVIQKFFDAKGIKGEIHDRPWTDDFGFNRTEVLKLADGKCDYMLMMDADDLLVGEANFKGLVCDSYRLKHGDRFHFYRTQVFRSGLGWRYEGVRHEAPVSDAAKTTGDIQGKYYWHSRTIGARNNDPLKYAKDAQVLEKALEKDPKNSRYWFYLGQSYYDAHDYSNSKRAYSKRVEMGGWVEEAYYAQYRVGACSMNLNEPLEQVIFNMLKAYEIRPSRAEALYGLATYLRAKGRYAMAYNFAMTAASIPYPVRDALFVHSEIYTFRALDELAVSAFWLGKFQESQNICKVLLDRDISEDEKKRIAANMKSCEERVKTL